MRVAGFVLLVIVAAFVFACSSSDSGAPADADAGVDGAAPPADGPGWHACAEPFEADPSGLGCRPLVATTCGVGQRPQLGTSACVDVAAAPCAAGFSADGWGCGAVLPTVACTGATKETLGATTCAAIDDCSAAFPPAAATLFVDAAGASDATHFTTIGAAVTAAAAGATIAIAAGTYTESITAAKAIHLVGRCAAQVIIASSGDATSGISATSGAVALEHVTLSKHFDGATAASGATLTLHQVVIDGSRGRGAAATGATVIVDGSVIRASESNGVEGANASTVKVTASAIVGNRDTGIKVAGVGNVLTIANAAILATRSTTSGFGLGVIVRDGARGDISNTAIADNHEVGLLVYGSASTATMTDSVVARTVASTSTVYGRGILVDTGSVAVTRTTLTGNQENAVVAEDKGTASLDGCVAKNTVSSTEGNDGNGASAISGGTVSFTGSAVIANAGAGVSALGTGAKVSLAQSLVMGTKGDATGQRGFGLALEMGGAATLTDVAFVENRDAGVAVTDMGSTVTADHVLVLRTQPGIGDAHGRGFGLDLASTGTLTKSAIVDNMDIGVQARAGSKLTFDELVVSGTLPQKSDGAHGRGLECGSGSSVDGKHATFDGNHEVSVLSIAEGSAVTLSSIWVAGTLADPVGAARALTAQSNASLVVDSAVLAHSAQAAVAATASSSLTLTSSVIDTTDAVGGDFGHGVLAWDGALASLSDVTISGSAGAGLVFDGSRGTVSACHITGNTVGIAAQDGSTLQESATVPDAPDDGQVVVSSDTAFDDNGAKIGSGLLVLPSPLGD